MKKFTFIAIIMAVVLFCFSNNKIIAQSFTGTYDFASITATSGTTDPSTVPSATGVTFGSFSAVGTPANPNASGRFSFVDWALDPSTIGDLDGVVNTGEYYTVTITPASGYTISLSTITFKIQRSSTGIRQYAVRSNLDSYAANLPASISPTNATLSVVGSNVFQITDNSSAQTGSTITLTPSFQNLGTTVVFRFYGWNSEASGGTFSIDDVVFSGTATSAGGPTKLVISSVNGGISPSASTPFSVTVQAQDASNVPANVSVNTNVTLSLATGTGSLGGTLTGTITAGTSTLNVSGVTYNTAESGVSLTATRTAGDNLAAGTSSSFSVLTGATHLAFVNEPVYGLVGTNLSSFTVEARRPDNTVDVNYTGTVSLSKVTGSGTLSGTQTKAAVAGIVTFNDIQMNIADNYTLLSTAGSLTSATSNTISLLASITYRSKVSGAWNSTSTWEVFNGSGWINSSEIPTFSNRDVLVQSGHTVNVPVSYNLGACRNLTVENGATLFANSSTGSCFVYVYGNIVNNGTIGGATDVIGFDIEGASCQISGSGSFIASRIAKFTTTNATTNMSIGQNVTLTYTSASSAALRNGTTTTLFNITLEAGKQLSVSNAKIDLAYCTLTLKDNASLLDNGTIAGMTTNVSVERFLTKYADQGDDMFHFLSSPVAAQAISPNFQSIASTNSDFYSWDEVTNMWINSLINNPTEWNPAFESNFTVGKGYLVAYPADVTKTFSGVLNTGNVVTALTYTPAQGNGWNLLGNPYPSAIDWNNVTSTNLDNAVYVYDNASATYKSYVAGVGTLTAGIVPSTQGFFVHANATSPSLTLENQDRVHAGTAFYKSDAIQNVVRLMVSGNNKADETIIRFAENATTAFDSQMDAYKLSGGASVPTFYSLAGNTKLSVNSLPSTSMEEYVTLAVEAGAASNYEISLAENTLSSSVYVTLEDTKTGVSQKLNDNPVYSFTAAPGEDPSRFRLHFKDATSVANPALAGINAYSVEGQIRITSDKNLNGLVTLTDMAGRLIAKTNMNQATSCMLNVHGQTGIYVVNIATTEGNFVQKVAVK